MRILLNDILQYTNIDDKLKSPMLSEITEIQSPFIITLDKQRPINSIGIGNTNGNYFVLNFNDTNNTQINLSFNGNGLYCFETVYASEIMITTNASYIGRLAAGLGINIPTSIAKEPGFNSTAEPRVTLSGQVISGVGGYNYKTLSLDSRYKINELTVSEIKEGYKYIGMGYPFFIDLTAEAYKLPFNKLYATERNQRQMRFEGGIVKYLYSRRWEFEERF